MRNLRSGLAVSTIFDAAELSEDAGQLLAASDEAREFAEGLVQNQLYPDAIAFLAHALPRREAVWWAWLCAREAAGEKASPVVVASLEATKSWIADPTDQHRRAAFEAAELAGIDTAVGFVALAAFFCGDTVGPADAPPAPPGVFAAAKAIAGCINLAAVADEAADISARYAELVQRGIELADRIQLWTPEAGTTAKG
jgi:hypothetical protein